MGIENESFNKQSTAESEQDTPQTEREESQISETEQEQLDVEGGGSLDGKTENNAEEKRTFNTVEIDNLKAEIQENRQSQRNLEKGGLGDTKTVEELNKEIEDQTEEYVEEKAGSEVSKGALDKMKRRVARFAGSAFLASLSILGSAQPTEMRSQESDSQRRETIEHQEHSQEDEDVEEEEDPESENVQYDVDDLLENRNVINIDGEKVYEDGTWETPGVGVEVTSEGSCVLTVKHVVEDDEGKDYSVDLQFYDSSEPDEEIAEDHVIIRMPDRDQAVVVPDDPQSISACVDYFEKRGENVPEDAKAFYEEYKEQKLRHISTRNREDAGSGKDQENFHEEPYMFEGKLSRLRANAVIPEDLIQQADINVDAAVLMLSGEKTIEGSSGSPIVNQDGEIVASHKGKVVKQHFEDKLQELQQQPEEEQNEEMITAIQEAIDHIENGGSVSILMPVVEQSVNYSLEQLEEISERTE